MNKSYSGLKLTALNIPFRKCFQGFSRVTLNKTERLYKRLKIFLCLNDPFGMKLPLYTYKTKCIQNASLTDDETEKLFYNVGKWEDSDNSDVRNFFKFIKTNEPCDEFTRSLSGQVMIARQNAEFRSTYLAMNWAIHEKLLDGFFKVQKEEVLAMSLTEYDAEEVMRDIREEGREIGIAEGTQQKAVEAAKNFLKMNVLSDAQIAEGTGLPLEQILELKNSLTVKV